MDLARSQIGVTHDDPAQTGWPVVMGCETAGLVDQKLPCTAILAYAQLVRSGKARSGISLHHAVRMTGTEFEPARAGGEIARHGRRAGHRQGQNGNAGGTA